LPDFETRVAIFEHKLAHRNIKLPRELVELVAHSVKTNVRDLEGIATKISAIMSFGNKTINHQVMGEVIADYVKVMIPSLSIESIVKLTALHYKVDPALLIGTTRKQNVTLPRQIAMYLSRKLMPELPLKTIGAYFGRDHSTVIYSARIILDLLGRDETLKATISQIEYALKTAPTDK
jgi:chromosomal replication initiator protein